MYAIITIVLKYVRRRPPNPRLEYIFESIWRRWSLASERENEHSAWLLRRCREICVNDDMMNFMYFIDIVDYSEMFSTWRKKAHIEVIKKFDRRSWDSIIFSVGKIFCKSIGNIVVFGNLIADFSSTMANWTLFDSSVFIFSSTIESI